MVNWYVRFDNNAPKWMPYICQDMTYANRIAFKPKKYRKISVYYNGKLQAHEMFQIMIDSAMFDTVKCGVLDCTISTITINIPDMFKHCKRNCEAQIRVKEIKAPLAYESTGKKFDSFLNEISGVWRKHAMKYVKDSIVNKKINPNAPIAPQEMHVIIKSLLKHCRNKNVVNEFTASLNDI